MCPQPIISPALADIRWQVLRLVRHGSDKHFPKARK